MDGNLTGPTGWYRDTDPRDTDGIVTGWTGWTRVHRIRTGYTVDRVHGNGQERTGCTGYTGYTGWTGYTGKIGYTGYTG